MSTSPENSKLIDKKLRYLTIRLMQYCLVMLIIIIFRITDLVITYIYTPNLKLELNPIVSIFGASWSGLIFSQVVIIAILSFVIFFYFFYRAPKITVPNLSFHNFVHYYFNGEFKPFRKRMVAFPRHLKRHLAFNGFMFMVLSILVSIFAIVHNLLLVNNVNWYISFLANNMKVFLYLLFFSAIFLSAGLFFLKEYSKYKSSNASSKQYNDC